MPYPMEDQKMGMWCWAAVSLSVEKYFTPGTGLSQCDIASTVKGKSCCPQNQLCNEADQLQVALGAVGNFNGMFQRPFSFQEVQEQIRKGFPVCARIGWYGGGGHFVVIAGYTVTESGEQWVAIADPLDEDSSWPFDEFVSAYYGAGEWTHTYLVKP